MRSSNLIRVASIFIFPAITLSQNTTLPVFLLNTNPQPLAASVVSANAATTSLVIGCPPGEGSSDCGFASGLDLENISGSIWQASMTPGEELSFSWSCQVVATSAVCVTSVGGAEANHPGMKTTTLNSNDIKSFPVTVTAGANSLSAGGAVTTVTTDSGTTSTTTPTASAVSTTGAFNTETAMSGSAGTAGGWSNTGFGAGIVLVCFVAAHLAVY